MKLERPKIGSNWKLVNEQLIPHEEEHKKDAYIQDCLIFDKGNILLLNGEITFVYDADFTLIGKLRHKAYHEPKIYGDDDDGYDDFERVFNKYERGIWGAFPTF